MVNTMGASGSLDTDRLSPGSEAPSWKEEFPHELILKRIRRDFINQINSNDFFYDFFINPWGIL